MIKIDRDFLNRILTTENVVVGPLGPSSINIDRTIEISELLGTGDQVVLEDSWSHEQSLGRLVLGHYLLKGLLDRLR